MTASRLMSLTVPLGLYTKRSSMTSDDGPTERLVSSRNKSWAELSRLVLMRSLRKTLLPTERSRTEPPIVPVTSRLTADVTPTRSAAAGSINAIDAKTASPSAGAKTRWSVFMAISSPSHEGGFRPLVGCVLFRLSVGGLSSTGMQHFRGKTEVSPETRCMTFRV